MTDPGDRTCRRCGTALVVDLPFCPRCGLDSAGVGEPAAPEHKDVDAPVDALGRRLDEPPKAGPVPPAPPRQFVDRGSQGTAIVFSALVVSASLLVFGFLVRPQGGDGGPAVPQGGSPGPGATVAPSGSAAAPSAPIVGITIESPRDGQAVATKDVTVIGIAPPGLTITRDISFGLDQHTIADGTGHWAIGVSLEEGENELVFRIGDDRATEKRVRVTYTPQAP